MIFAILLAAVAVCGGALATYIYEDDSHLAARLAAGAPVGLAALGLVGFVAASFVGLGAASLAVATLFVAAPLALLIRADFRARLRFDAGELWRDVRGAVAGPTLRSTAPLVLVACALMLFWIVFGRAMFTRAGAIYTGVDNNLGDLPFHISIVESFVRGANFPPTHPEYAGARLTYPFVVDFVAAMFVRAGASLEGALFLENVLLAVSLTGLLYRFALAWTRDRLAAAFAPALVLFSGGLGFVRFYREASASPRGFTDFLWQLPHDYTITFDGAYRWGNAVTTLLVPQRGLLLGLPLALVVITQWWLAVGDDENDAGTRGRGDAAKEEVRGKKGKKARGQGDKGRATDSPPPLAPFDLPFVPARDRAGRRMLYAGFVACLLPLVHAHTFVVLMLVGGCLALLFPRWRAWIVFFVAALVGAAPAMLWATRGTAAHAGSFFAWNLGWDRGAQNPVWFWIKNTGLFIPLLVRARSGCAEAAAHLLPAVHAALRHLQRGEDFAVGMGQHQGALLLVRRLRAARRAPARAPVADERGDEVDDLRTRRRAHARGRARRVARRVGGVRAAGVRPRRRGVRFHRRARDLAALAHPARADL
jgi:hypothetical protein